MFIYIYIYIYVDIYFFSVKSQFVFFVVASGNTVYSIRKLDIILGEFNVLYYNENKSEL